MQNKYVIHLSHLDYNSQDVSDYKDSSQLAYSHTIFLVRFWLRLTWTFNSYIIAKLTTKYLRLKERNNTFYNRWWMQLHVSSGLFM